MILRQSTAVDVLIGPFLDLTDGATAEAGESPSVKLSKNGQALAAKNDATTPVHDADGYYNCELDATDTNTVGTLVLTVAKSANALPVRHEFQVVEEATYDLLYASGASPLADIADNVWDEAISGHQTLATFGRYSTLAGGILVDTTITGTPSSTTVQLSSGSAVNDFYADQTLHITSGTGAGQARVIASYDGSTKTITVDEAFATTPAASDGIVVLSDHVHPVSQIADAVWDEDATGHQAAGTFGEALGDPAASGNSVRDLIAALNDLSAAEVNTQCDTAISDAFNFTVAGQVDANVQYVNDIAVTGAGTSGDPWGP